ncbi:acylneuraminate cytidylyltransferase family protein [Crocosphaera sp. UHCC 0190]|uniref:acylneuraminate cytidylyltransferase family protein n=1 Tax=Crocosphaera sp. UHCC 0190 TaxID=3110246 RepID=UPI002B1F326D|nr:acylneuraminate cytidylyltransferase family protein [Crocosphaera sp. UHCC 0190]MEA5511320.1 acylneuraminate cytidylyltransferase family protein [Crocosphaera sp. UHCC 0190]
MAANSPQPTIVAFVPMRHSSERVIGKNYRLFAGKPLYHYVVESLLNCPQITQVCIDTDSPNIIEDAQQNFPAVKVILRPEHLRSGMTPMNDVLLNSVAQVPADYYLQTHSTNPLLKSTTISKAIDLFFKSPDYDSLFGVTRLQTRLYDAEGKAMNHDPNVLLRTQDLPPVYEENSNLYIFTKTILEERKNRIGYKPLMIEIERDEAWDIDEEVDFRIAELLYQTRQKATND